MKRRLLGLGLALAALACSSSGRTAGERPNVLLIIVDDLSFRIGLYGFAPPTPNLARLASLGRRFDRAYAQYPLCSPSRASFMTGWRPERTQVWGNLGSPHDRLAGAVPLQQHFAASGYETVRLGKVYHSPFEHEFRWERVYDTDDATPDEVAAIWGASGRSDEDEPDGRAARRAVEVLKERRSRPLFLAVGFLRPHLPWMVPEAYVRRFPPESVVVPPQPAQAVLGERRGASRDIPPARWREAIAHYQASVAFMDAQLGLILDALERERLFDRTVVVLAGDNGIHVGEHGLWGKSTLFEDSARVPLVIAAPGVSRPGTPTGSLAELVDLYPTLLELCRLPKVNGLDGVSLVPLLRDPEAKVKDAAWTMRKLGAARKEQLAFSVRTERWRLTEWPGGERELYDHDADPWELLNLAGDPAYAAVVARLQPLVETAARRVSSQGAGP